MRFTDGFLEELRAKNDIETVVSSYVQLKPSGRLLSGLCPFHGEKTPSFYVYPETQSYYCFGCGAGGDVITFVRTAENLSYVDAVRLLANRAGLAMPEDQADDGTANLRKRCYSANREAAKFFHQMLQSDVGKSGFQYFHSRGVTPATIRHFGLGFAPDDWNCLTKHLRSLGFRDDELVQFNLSRKSKNGRVYDAFRNRVMFPIIDLQGNVVAFGGRVLDDSKPKYLNTSDTVVYKKSRGVFALNFAKNNSTKELILCEGYMDVIALHQAGFTNAVAGLGTALTEEQALLLSRYASQINICYDADEAGRKAAEKAVHIFSRTNVKIKVLRLTGGKDPDEIIKNSGVEKMRSILSGAMNDTEFRLSQAKEHLDLQVADDRLSYANEAVKILATLSNPIERDLYASKIANETGVSKSAVLSQVDRARRYQQKKQDQTRFALIEKQMNAFSKNEFYPPGTPIRVRNAEEHLLASLYRNPDFLTSSCKELSANDFSSQTNRTIFQRLTKIIEQGKNPSIHAFNDCLTPDEMGHLSKILTFSEKLGNNQKECQDCVAAIQEAKKAVAPQAIGKLNDDDFLKLFTKK